MPDAATIRRVAALVAAGLAVRVMSAVVVAQPGYTDAYYYVNVASRFARGLGLTADFVWNPIELGPLPVASHLFWMPLATVVQAAGIVLFGPVLGDFRAAQLAIVVIAAIVPVVTYAAARLLGASERASLVAAGIAALGGLFAPAWVSLDGFAPAAVIGTLFFLFYSRAVHGWVPSGAAAGIAVGLLYLTRSEGALFGLALLALALRRPSRAAGVTGAVAALLIGGAWFARDVSVGVGNDLITRTVLLARYEEFFSLFGPTTDIFHVPFGDVLIARGAALGTNALTFCFAYGLVLVAPLAFGVRVLWANVTVRAWTSLAILIFLAQSLLWTLHSTRGSYFHSLAAFFPFGLAIAAVGGEQLLAARRVQERTAWSIAAVFVFAAMSYGAVSQWDTIFNTGARARAAALDAIPAGSFLAIDAAAWRWISGRSVIVTPADGFDAARCAWSFADPHPTSLVLEEAHFRAYDALYQGGARPPWLGPPIERGPMKIYPVVDPTVVIGTRSTTTDIVCAVSR